ncbi:MAG: glycosyltransferase family A protein [Desulfobulbus sp.]
MITILTPSFNRAHTLTRLYSSLCAQKCSAFEWLIVDDGSKDNTESLVDGFRLAGEIEVRYHRQNNSGKHVALNTGACLSRGEWVYIVDSDDALTIDALEVIERTLLSLDQPNAVGVCFRRAYFNGVIIGKSAPVLQPLVMSPTQAGDFLKGDLAYVFKTDIFKRVPFPMIPGEKFVPELYIWNKISDLGDIVFYTNTVTYLCDYLEDGYTHNFKKNLLENPLGFLIFYVSQVSREKNYIRKLKCVIRSLQCMFYAIQKG